MRLENLPDGGHDKVTWKSCTDLLTRSRNNVTLRIGRDVPQRRYWVSGYINSLSIHTTQTPLGVSFQSCLRHHYYVLLSRCHNVPIRCCGDVPLRSLSDVPSRSCWMFHLRRNCDVTGTYRKTPLWRCYDVLMPGGMQVYMKVWW